MTTRSLFIRSNRWKAGSSYFTPCISATCKTTTASKVSNRLWSNYTTRGFNSSYSPIGPDRTQSPFPINLHSFSHYTRPCLDDGHQRTIQSQCPPWFRSNWLIRWPQMDREAFYRNSSSRVSPLRFQCRWNIKYQRQDNGRSRTSICNSRPRN